MGSIVNNEPLPALLTEIASLLDDHKGEETLIMDVRGDCGFTDFFVLTTVGSSRHLASLVAHTREFLRERGVPVLNRVQPHDLSGWALLDCGGFIVHVMERAERTFYELEKLWFRSRTFAYSSKSS